MSRPPSPSHSIDRALLARLVVMFALTACQQAVVQPPAPDRSGGTDAAARPDGFALPDATVDMPSPYDACVPVGCSSFAGHYCGQIGDGCKGKLDCGGCPTGQICGGAGIPNVCGKPIDTTCKAITCDQPGGQICGRVGDGCGRALMCGDCPAGQTCGLNIPSICSAGQCDNLCLQRKVCPAGRDTTVSGTVFAPSKVGADPIYNAFVYVPNAALQPFSPGVTCSSCGFDISGQPIASTLSGPDGKFTLTNVPVGTNIPLVIQIGRWRRQVTIPQVSACGDTALPAELTRLPRNHTEGDIPLMAIATGAFDQVECLLRKIGIDDSEFTVPTGSGRVHMYRFFGSQLAGVPYVPGVDLTGDLAALRRYDIVLLPCDSKAAKPADAMANLVQYANLGGRLFLTDWSYSWLVDNTPWKPLVDWQSDPTPLGNDYDAIVDQSFPKGEAFATWLGVVGASPTAGRIPIHDFYGGNAFVGGLAAGSRRWLYTDKPGSTVQHFTFNTPVEAPVAKQCGRVLYSNFHILPDESVVSPVFPGFCMNTPMTPQEKALEFMLFDATGCVQPDTDKPRVFGAPPVAPPAPPPIIN